MLISLQFYPFLFIVRYDDDLLERIQRSFTRSFNVYVYYKLRNYNVHVSSVVGSRILIRNISESFKCRRKVTFKVLGGRTKLPPWICLSDRWQYDASFSVARTGHRVLSQFTHLHPLYTACFSRRRTRRRVTGKRRFVSEIVLATNGSVVERRQNSDPSHPIQHTRVRVTCPCLRVANGHRVIYVHLKLIIRLNKSRGLTR